MVSAHNELSTMLAIGVIIVAIVDLRMAYARAGTNEGYRALKGKVSLRRYNLSWAFKHRKNLKQWKWAVILGAGNRMS